MNTRTTTLAAALLVAGALALTGCSAGGPVVSDEREPAGATQQPAEDSPEPEPAAEIGTRGNPVPVGTPAQYSSDSMWEFTLGATNPDAWGAIAAANQFNSPPAEGSVYITVPVHVRALDVESAANGADPIASFSVEYVTASGNSYDSTTCTAVLPEPGDQYKLGTMYGGAEADFLACAGVPAADVPGGTWKIRSYLDFDTVVFFAGA